MQVVVAWQRSLGEAFFGCARRPQSIYLRSAYRPLHPCCNHDRRLQIILFLDSGRVGCSLGGPTGTWIWWTLSLAFLFAFLLTLSPRTTVCPSTSTSPQLCSSFSPLHARHAPLRRHLHPRLRCFGPCPSVRLHCLHQQPR